MPTSSLPNFTKNSFPPFVFQEQHYSSLCLWSARYKGASLNNLGVGYMVVLSFVSPY